MKGEGAGLQHELRARAGRPDLDGAVDLVGAIPDPLEELKPSRRRIENDRCRVPGYEYFLGSLCERDDRYSRQIVGVHRLERGRQLPPATVDDDANPSS